MFRFALTEKALRNGIRRRKVDVNKEKHSTDAIKNGHKRLGVINWDNSNLGEGTFVDSVRALWFMELCWLNPMKKFLSILKLSTNLWSKDSQNKKVVGCYRRVTEVMCIYVLDRIRIHIRAISIHYISYRWCVRATYI